MSMLQTPWTEDCANKRRPSLPGPFFRQAKTYPLFEQPDPVRQPAVADQRVLDVQLRLNFKKC